MLAVFDTGWLTAATVVVAGYYLALLGISTFVDVRRRRSITATPVAPDRPRPFVVIVIPARNEERVIGIALAALERIGGTDHGVLVMNDSSSDATSFVTRCFQRDGARVDLIERSPSLAGRGKGDVLNHAFHLVCDSLHSGDSALSGLDPSQVIIGVMDADGQLEPDALERVIPMFDDPEVAAVQLAVRIENATSNLLTRMQDIEFVGFSGLVQNARNAFGSVGLGGNGQFTRLSALIELDRDPWSDCLSEDLDLSLSLVAAGHQVRFCGESSVAQQGLTHVRPLIRQRARWVQGHYQCWRHIVPLLRSRRVSWRTKLDLTIYLVMISFLVLITVGIALSLASLLGLMDITNSFWSWVPEGAPRNAVLLSLSCGPAIAFVYIYQRRAKERLRPFEVPAFAAAFCFYGYHWIAAQMWAFARIISGRRNWAKTPRELVGATT